MKNKNINVDDLLKSALSNQESPDPALIQNIKYQLNKEENSLKKNPLKCSFRTAVLAAIAFTLITTTAFAAWHFISPWEAANRLSYPVLADAFRSENALLINETQSQNGYNVTFLGIVSGQGLTELEPSLDYTRSYAMVAISKQDGSMEEAGDNEMPFFVSPLIIGQNPWQYNIASMNGGYVSFVSDGVLYRLIDCDDLEIFADRGLALIVSSTRFYDIDAYNYDETTGQITPNPDFEGINLIFDLPLDPTKADYEKAQQYLDSLWAETEITKSSNEFFASEENSDGISREMNYESYQAWMTQRLEKAQESVDRGEYSADSLALDRLDYENTLRAIENGAAVTITEFEDGSYSMILFYEQEEFSITTNDAGDIVISD